jgi:hypothetical protein
LCSWLLNLSTKRMSAEAEISLSREIEWGITLSSLLSLQRTKPLFPPLCSASHQSRGRAEYFSLFSQLRGLHHIWCSPLA